MTDPPSQSRDRTTPVTHAPPMRAAVAAPRRLAAHPPARSIRAPARMTAPPACYLDIAPEACRRSCDLCASAWVEVAAASRWSSPLRPGLLEESFVHAAAQRARRSRRRQTWEDRPRAGARGTSVVPEQRTACWSAPGTDRALHLHCTGLDAAASDAIGEFVAGALQDELAHVYPLVETSRAELDARAQGQEPTGAYRRAQRSGSRNTSTPSPTTRSSVAARNDGQGRISRHRRSPYSTARSGAALERRGDVGRIQRAGGEPIRHIEA